MSLQRYLPVSILCVVILLMTLWGGGIYPLSLVTTTIILAIGAGVFIWISLRTGSNTIGISLLPAAMLAVILYQLLTAVPLPGRLDAMTGGKRYEENNRVRAVIEESTELGLIKNVPTRFSITRNRSGTLRSIILMIAVLSSAALSANIPAKKKTLWLESLAFFGALFAVAGFIHQWILPEKQTFWWFDRINHGQPVGCFVSRTHFAGYIALFAPICFLLFMKYIARKNLLKAGLFFIAFFIICFATVMSHSRGAVLALACSIFAVLILGMKQLKPGSIIAVLFITAALGYGMLRAITMLPAQQVQKSAIERLETLKDPMQTTSGQIRMSLWKDSIRIWKHYPVLGAGADGFQMVYSNHRSENSRKSFLHAENEYLQVLVDGGIIGVVLLILVSFAVWKEWKSSLNHNETIREIFCPVLGAVTVAAVHNAMDFPLYVPLYSITLASIVGLTFSSIDRQGSKARPAFLCLKRKTVGVLFVITGVALMISLVIPGETAYNMDHPELVRKQKCELLANALVRAPTSWNLWSGFGTTCFAKKTGPAMLLGERCIVQATEYDPNNYLLWEHLGYIRLNMGRDKEANEAFRKMKELRPWKKGPRSEVKP